VQDGRIHIELINGPFLYELLGSPAEYKAALDFAIERGWLWKHESGTYVKFTQAGDEVQLYAFDILALDGDDLQACPYRCARSICRDC
jgi:hypothetical protein